MRPQRLRLFCLLAIALLTIGGSATQASAADTDLATGTVRIVAVDGPGPDPGTSATSLTAPALVTRAVADVAGHLVDLPATPGTVLHSGDTVTVRTVPSGAVEAVTSVQRTATSTATSGRVGAQATAAPVLGKHSLLVLPVYWSAPDDATTASLSALAAATSAYWSQQSGGAIAISTSVRSWVRITDPGSCQEGPLADLALAAHHVALPTSNFDHVLIYFPTRADCGWGGLGQIGGSLIWDNGLQLTDVTAHEFGHNLGLGHAKISTCAEAGQPVTLSSSCTVTDYGDTADVMGSARYQATGNLNTAMADWLQLSRTVTATPGLRTTVVLAPLAQVANVRAVRIRVPTGWVYADYRPAVGRDVRMPGWAGVQLHLLPDGPMPQSQLLDAQPADAAAAAVSLPVGVPWTVPGADLTITVTSIGPAGARLDVAPPAADTTVPVPMLHGLVTGTAISSATGSAAGTVTSASTRVTWQVPAPVSALELLVDGRLRSQTVTATSAGVSTLSGSVTLTGLTAGHHRLTAEALDASGRFSAPSAAVTVNVDLSPPSIPTGLALSGAGVLSWRPSSDAVAGVRGYLVALDGAKPAAISSGTSRSVVTPAGRHVWSVSAVDRVGNTSRAALVTVFRTTPAATSATAAGTATPASPVAVDPVTPALLRGTVGPRSMPPTG